MKVIILGAGPSGLGAAWSLIEAGHKDVLILEKEDRVGGLSGSFVWEGCSVDYGPHRFSPEFPELNDRIKEFMGSDWLEIKNEHAVVYKERVYSYPPKISDFLNWQSIQESIRVMSGLIRSKIIFSKFNQIDTFEKRIKKNFGSYLYSNVVAPLSEKVWGRIDQLDPDFADLRFSVPTFIQWGKKLMHHRSTFNDATFFYPRLGFQQLWDELASNLVKRGVKIVCGANVKKIRTDKNLLSSVNYEIGNQVFLIEKQALNLLSTIPVHSLVKLLEGNESEQYLSEVDFSVFRERGMILIGILIEREKVLPARVVIFPEKKYCFNRLSEQNQFSRDTVPKGYTLVMADVLLNETEKLSEQDEKDLILKVKTEILSLEFFKEEEIRNVFLRRISKAYPFPSLEREKEQRKLNKILSENAAIYLTGRFSSSDYNNSHTALKKGRELGMHIFDCKDAKGWYEKAEPIRRLPIRD